LEYLVFHFLTSQFGAINSKSVFGELIKQVKIKVEAAGGTFGYR
jgi:hypothetical protein